MAIIDGNHQLCVDICKALGLPEYIRGFEITAGLECLVIARCEFIVTDGQLGKIKTAMAKYKITAEEIKS